MYQVEWRPAPDTTYPDRPASPGAGQKGASQGVGADEPVKKAYVPPHMRGKEGEARKTISLHVLEDAKKVGGMASFGAVTGGKNLPPGASEEDEKLSKSALKKKKVQPRPQTLNPKPYAPNSLKKKKKVQPRPQTLNPGPETLDPRPKTQDPRP
jgi:hypothetical protein